MKELFYRNAGVNPTETLVAECVKQTLAQINSVGSSVLVFGEHHHKFSHQIAQATALRDLAKIGQQTILFMEYPHNRLYTMLTDRGFNETDASTLADHIGAIDDNGHITAKAIIGGNETSLRGENFHNFQSQLVIQAAIHHGIHIVNADAARVYPNDYCIDYNDKRTSDIADIAQARRGLEGQMGPDDMLIRNTHMAQTIKDHLDVSGGVALLPTGAAHVFGIEDEKNGRHSYADSLASRFEDMDINAVLVSMNGEENLPPDFPKEENDKQHRLFASALNPDIVTDLSDVQILECMNKNGLSPDLYDPRKFAEQYRIEFNIILNQACNDLNISTTSRNENHVHAIPNLKTTVYCPVN